MVRRGAPYGLPSFGNGLFMGCTLVHRGRTLKPRRHLRHRLAAFHQGLGDFVA